jgi:DNA repair ATPase RecN
MPLPFPGPSSLIGAAGKGFEAIEHAMSLVPRLGVVVAEVEQIVVRVHAVVSGIEQTQLRADAMVEQTEDVVARAADLTARAGPLIEQLEQFEPTLLRLQPILERLAETTDPDEVSAIVAMVDLLPDLVEKFRDDIVPILDTFGTVAPDLRDLLDASREFNDILGAIPGVGRVKRKIEEQQDEEDLRAEETPPTAPARKR